MFTYDFTGFILRYVHSINIINATVHLNKKNSSINSSASNSGSAVLIGNVKIHFLLLLLQIGHVSEVHRATMLLNRNPTGASKLSSNKSGEDSGVKPKFVRSRTFIQRDTRMIDISDVIVGLPQSVSYLVHPNKPILLADQDIRFPGGTSMRVKRFSHKMY